MYTKKDLSFKLIYDPALPIDYFCLTLPLQNRSFHSKRPFIHGKEVITNCWLLTKPNAVSHNRYFNWSENSHLMFYFSKKWLSKNAEETDFRLKKMTSL